MIRIKVLSIFGTRPEAIKMAPLIREMEKCINFESYVCVTAQHRKMLDQVLEIFNIRPDFDLNIMTKKQSLTSITTKVLDGLSQVFTIVNPDLVLVHGDTTTTFAGALAAFYHQIPVGHVEAGLRTFDKFSPFPEEMNRVLTSRIAELHFAPTKQNKLNLNKENVHNNVFVTGNTVVDAMKYTVKDNYKFKNHELNKLNFKKSRFILVTAHRRENLGEPLHNICDAIIRIINNYRDVQIIFPVHLNPGVRTVIFSTLGNTDRVNLIEPVDVQDMHNLMNQCFLIMTDSGGLQEEAPSLGIPVLVLRTETERPEAVEAGTVKVVGTDAESIFYAAKTLLEDKHAYEVMAKASNPYGDGKASERIVRAIIEWFARRQLKASEGK